MQPFFILLLFVRSLFQPAILLFSRACAWTGSATFCCILVLPAGSSRAADAPITIRVSTQWPLANSSNLTFIHFKERVEADSKGALRVEIYDGAKLYGDSAIAGAVSSGAVEMGYINLSRYAAIIPAADAFQLPFMFNTNAIASAARAPGSEIRTLIDDAILTQNQSRVLWWVPSGVSVLLSNGQSVANPEVIAGKTVRTFGPMIEAIVRECGGIPKDIGGQEQEKAYQTHAVDIGMSGMSIVMERKLTRFMSIVTRTNHSSVEGVAVINEKFWQSLPAAYKGFILEASEAANDEGAALLTASEAAAYRTLTGNGIKIVDLSDEELLQWRICSGEVLTDFVEKSGKLGRDLILAYGRLRQQPCCNALTRSVSPR
jgi:C4-dicarboxylate-binding protein DctP